MIYNDKHRAMGILSSKKPQKNNLIFTPSQTNPIHQQSINIIETEEEKKKENKEEEELKEEIENLKKKKETNLSGKLPQYEIININSEEKQLRKLPIKRMDSISRSPEREYKNSLALFEENFDFLVERIQNSSNIREENKEKIKNRKRHSLILKMKTNELLLSKQLIKVV